MPWIGDFVCNDKPVCGQWQCHRFFFNINFCLLQIVKFVEEEKGNLAIQANQHVECVCTNTGDEGRDEKEDKEWSGVIYFLGFDCDNHFNYPWLCQTCNINAHTRPIHYHLCRSLSCTNKLRRIEKLKCSITHARIRKGEIHSNPHSVLIAWARGEWSCVWQTLRKLTKNELQLTSF